MFAGVGRYLQRQATLRAIRFLKPDTAVLYSDTETRGMPGREASSAPEPGFYDWIVMKRQGRWQIVVWHESNVMRAGSAAARWCFGRTICGNKESARSPGGALCAACCASQSTSQPNTRTAAIVVRSETICRASLVRSSGKLAVAMARALNCPRSTRRAKICRSLSVATPLKLPG